MTDKKTRPDQLTHLRKRAEERARGKATLPPENIETLSPEEIRRTLHELRVHQIELEMQNDELRLAQAELDTARARYFDLYDLAPAGYCTLSEKGLILETNLTAAILLGVARGALVEQPLSRFIFPDDQDIYYRHRQRLFKAPAISSGQAGEPQACELRMVKNDGTAFWVHLAATAAQDADGVTVCRIVLGDITERKRAEAALSASEEKYRSLVENINIGIFLTTLDGKFLHANSTLAMMAGYDSVDNFMTISATELYADASDRQRFIRALRTKGYVKNDEVQLKRKDGTLYWVSRNASLLKDASGQPTMMIGSISDITEKRNLEAQLQRAQKMEAIGTLAGGIAHDFNNLLTGILGYANLLTLKGKPGTTEYEAARTIERAAERASELTRQLLGFAQRGKHQIQPVEIHALILDVIRLLGRTIDKRIILTQRFPSGAPHVKGDPGQLQQVLMNLAINARDAMENGGELTFETEIVNNDEEYCKTHVDVNPGPYLMISVTDTGTGIPKKHLNRIFEPFYTTKELGKGSGMGLAMVYGIVKNHGGYVTVYSEIGQGTTFKVYLPLEAAAMAEKEQPQEQKCSGTGRILVIDDEELIRNFAAEILKDLGYDVITAVDGQEGVDIFRKEPQGFDLVIIDMIMPKLGGRDCFQELKKINPHIKAILSTGYGINGKAQEILDEGVMGFIQKPYRIAQFSQVVNQVLSTSS